MEAPLFDTVMRGKPIIIDDIRGDSELARVYQHSAGELMDTGGVQASRSKRTNGDSGAGPQGARGRLEPGARRWPCCRGARDRRGRSLHTTGSSKCNRVSDATGLWLGAGPGIDVPASKAGM